MCLLQTLKNVAHTLEYVKSRSVEVRFHGRGKNEASHYCGQCEVNYLNKKNKMFYTNLNDDHIKLTFVLLNEFMSIN